MSQPDTLTEKYVLAVTLPIAALSFFGSAALICTFLSFRDSVQSQSRRLIFFLSVADLGQSIFFLLPGFAGSRFACVVLSMFGIMSALASFLWTVIISHFVWKTVHNPTEIQSNYSSNYHFIGWGYPILTILILLISAPTWEPYNTSKFDVFGPDSSVGWCFIPKEYPLQRLLTIYAPLAACWFLTAFFYLSARNQVREMTNDTITTPLAAQRHEAMQEVMQKLTLIPAGFIALRMWGALYRMFYVFRDQDSPNAEQNFVDEFRWYVSARFPLLVALMRFSLVTLPLP